MTVHDAEPGDVYVDEGGKLWRCVSICHEPTVTMEEVEGHTSTPPDPMVMQAASAQQYRPPMAPPIIRDRRGGGVSGLMWNGWQRIWRKEEAKPKADIFSRPECIFNYCPNPELCVDACLTPRKPGG